MMQRLLRELTEVEVAPLPTREEIAKQLTKAKRELAEYHRLRAAREAKQAEIRLRKTHVHQRMLDVQEREEGRIVQQLERKLGINFREGRLVD